MKQEAFHEFAKNMFLELDQEGKQAYTFEIISNAIQNKFKKKVHYSTIAKWAKKFEWYRLLSETKSFSVQKAIQNQDEKDRIIQSAKADHASMYFSSLANAYKILEDELNRRKNETPLQIYSVDTDKLISAMTKIFDRLANFLEIKGQTVEDKIQTLIDKFDDA